MLFVYTYVKSRTRSDRKVITLRNQIKSAMTEAPSAAFFDPAADPRFLAHLAHNA